MASPPSPPISICEEKVLWRGHLRSPHDVIYHRGYYIVTDKGNHRVVACNPFSETPKDLHDNMSGVPKAVAESMEPYGVVATSATEPNFLVTDSRNKCVLECQNGQWSIWTKRTPEGLTPTGIAVDRSRGRVYVGDFSNHCVHLYSKDGLPQKSFGHEQLVEPWFMAFDSRDQLYVADAMKGVQVFSAEGEHRRALIVQTSGAPWSCRGITIDKYDNVFVSSRVKNSWRLFSTESVAAFDKDHQPLEHSTGFMYFNFVRGICVDHDRGHLVVVDGENHSLVRYVLYK